MNHLSEVSLTPLEKSIYLKPLTMHFNLNGCKRTWDVLEVHDVVTIILFNTSRNVLVLVKQFRPAVYLSSIPRGERNNKIDIDKYPAELGITVELCAGIIDKELSNVETAKQEVLEECGYDVSLSQFEKITSYQSGVGASGSIETAYYCEVTDDMKVGPGGGVDEESIEVIEMTIPEIKAYITQNNILSTGNFLFSINWLLCNKVK